MAAAAGMTVFEVAETFFAGLGMFFFGVRMVGSTFKEMAGRRLHRLAAHGRRHPALAGAAGGLFAGITQSATPVTFIAVARITGGLMEVGHAMPMAIWAEVGTSVMVWLSALNVAVGRRSGGSASACRPRPPAPRCRIVGSWRSK